MKEQEEYNQIPENIAKISPEGKFNVQFKPGEILDQVEKITNLKYGNLFLNTVYDNIKTSILDVNENNNEFSIEVILINIQLLISDFLYNNVGINGFRFGNKLKNKLKNIDKTNFLEEFNNVFLNEFLYFLDKIDLDKIPNITVPDNFFKQNQNQNINYGKITAELEEGKIKFNFKYDNENRELRNKSFENSKINKELLEFKEENKMLLHFIIEEFNVIFLDISTYKDTSFIGLKDNHLLVSLEILNNFLEENKKLLQDKNISMLPKLLEYINEKNIYSFDDFLKEEKLTIDEIVVILNTEFRLIYGEIIRF